mmetsp:Transcript_38635/g.81240  ORF Transcript_38635/g.81240 Transcript_38635/m.81240 type:complete len:443 (+) Transcript_38635:349-1677(+)
MGDSRVKMVCHMGGSNFVVEEVNGTPGVEFVVGTVDGVEGAPDEVVVIVGEVWHINIRVLKPCVENQPGIDNNKRTSIDCHHLWNTIARCPSQGSSSNERYTNITLVNLLLPVSREQFLLGLLGLRQRLWVVMIGHSSVWSTSSTDQKIRWPSNNQMNECLKRTINLNSLLITKFIQKALPQLQRIVQLLASIQILILGNVRLPKLHVIRVSMVHSMRTLPRIVWHEEQTVQYIPHSILQLSILAKSTVSTFVSEHPQSHGNGAGHDGISQPEGKGQNVGRVQVIERLKSKCRAECSSNHRDAEVSQTLGRFGLEAISRNDLTDRSRIGEVGRSTGKCLALKTREGNTIEINERSGLFRFLLIVVVGCGTLVIVASKVEHFTKVHVRHAGGNIDPGEVLSCHSRFRCGREGTGIVACSGSRKERRDGSRVEGHGWGLEESEN